LGRSLDNLAQAAYLAGGTRAALRKRSEMWGRFSHGIGHPWQGMPSEEHRLCQKALDYV
jgi:hypothetical protein